jgi:hypothetical protein
MGLIFTSFYSYKHDDTFDIILTKYRGCIEIFND